MVEMTMRFYHIPLIVLIAGLAFFAHQNSKYVVTEGAQVVVTQFGKVTKSQTRPGTFYKIPIIQKTHYYKNQIQTAESSHPVPTLDKKFLELTIRAFWNISDPVLYFKSVYSFRNATNRVIDIAEPAGRMVIISHNLSEIVNEISIKETEHLKSKREIELEILTISKPELLKFGIELINIEAKIKYPI